VTAVRQIDKEIDAGRDGRSRSLVLVRSSLLITELVAHIVISLPLPSW